MDKIRQKAQSLLEKLHDKYGVQSKHHIHLVLATMGKKEGEGAELQDHWYLVDTHNHKFRLPKTMLFLGSQECDVVVASQSVDKRHAILAFDIYLNRFKVKDLSTRNGTYVNNFRIPEQEYVILNHMDSIRLGQDTMMYHMEQASQITTHGGLLPDPQFIPNWANRAQETAILHAHPHDSTECQELHYIGLYGWFPKLGCIAEQKVEHTCTLKHGESKDGSPHTHHPHYHQHSHHHHHPHPEHAVEHHQEVSQVAHMDYNRQQNQHLDQELLIPELNRDKQSVDRDHTSDTDPRGSLAHLHNTWPVKPQVKPVVQSGSIFDTDLPVKGKYQDDSPQTMFFVPFDDSVCHTNSGQRPNEQGRRSRSDSGAHSPELAKKGTLFHGQPSVWGDAGGPQEGDASAACSSMDKGGGRDASHISPPSIQGLNREKAVSSPATAALGTKVSIMESERLNPVKGPTYMEIPLRDDDSPEGVKPRNVKPLAKKPSLSKDSLPSSPELKQPSKPAKLHSPGTEKNPATSFTVDLDEPGHPPKVSLNIGSSISELLPPKIRKTFEERKAMSSKASSKESTPSKLVDEREVSPLADSRINEIWSTVVEGKGRPKQPGKPVGASHRSPSLDEVSSDDSRLQSTDNKKGSSKKNVPGSSPVMLQSSKVDSPPAAKSGSDSPVINTSKYSTSYLFDKMFEGGNTASVRTARERGLEHHVHKSPAGLGERGLEHHVHKSPADLDHASSEKTLARPVINPEGVATNQSLAITAKKPFGHAVVDDDLRITEDVISIDANVGARDDKEDRVSEAGTYTIEADVSEGLEEEKEARKRIDQVFGVEGCDPHVPLIDQLDLSEQGGCSGTLDLGDDSENTLLDVSNLSPEDENIDLILDDSDDENSDMASTNGLQTWVSQLTSLTSHKSADSSRGSKEDGHVSLSKKPPQGINKKRPGTGRKLPSIPTDKSPTVADSYAAVNNLTAGRLSDHAVTDRNSSGGIKLGTTSSQPHSRTAKNGHPTSPSSSTISHGSIYTPISSHGGEAATAALHMSYRSADRKHSQDSNVDVVSNVALVNGSEDYVTPVLYKNPRDAIEKRQQKEFSIKPVSASLGKKSGGNMLAQTAPLQKHVTSPKSPPSFGSTKKSLSDLFSRKDSLDNGSIVSDVSSDAGDGSHSKLSSKAKGTITMTRTNKTFDLRRARADSLDSPTAKSAKSLLSSKTNASSLSGRPLSLHSSVKNKTYTDPSHSEVTSIVAQSVKKSQSNISQDKLRRATSNVASRTDSGKHILNTNIRRADSLTISNSAAGKREPTPKFSLRSTPAGRSSLTIAGISSFSGQSQSQPGSRSSSPKTTEKLAWKRRKEYDARKSVAEAKSNKAKEGSSSGITIRPKTSTNSDVHRRMIRSASFTNNASLSLSLHSSVSGSHQDFSDRKDFSHHRDELRKAFVPFHTPQHNGKSAHSADEYDSIGSTAFSQDKNLVSLLEIPSAFTPPLLRNKQVSRENSPSEASLSLRRRTLNMDGEQSPSSAKNSNNSGNDGEMGRTSAQSSPQTSYDSLIVASVYQLSHNLKVSTEKILTKLRDANRMSHTPSPVEDFLNHSGKSEMVAWKSANQELSGTLKNLRTLERHVQIMNGVLFHEVGTSSETLSDTSVKRHAKPELLEVIERNLGFQPIDHPITYSHTDDVGSPEMMELSSAQF